MKLPMDCPPRVVPDTALAPPVITAAPAAAPAAAALATSAVPIFVEPEASVAAIESDLYTK